MTFSEALRQAWPAGIPTRRLRGVHNAVSIATTCRQYWFRGQERKFESLLPKVHRFPFRSASPNIEFRAAQRFRLRANSFASKVPDWADYTRWLFVMQHHGVPTRLLDWTESVLVALYFAAAEPDDQPGELWCMNPSSLNACSKRHICAPDDPPIRYFSAEVFSREDPLLPLRETIEISASQKLPLALIPPFEFPRIAAQLGRFTIHPSYEGNESIEFLLRDEADLARYTVPAARKSEIRKDLARLGISHDTLFHSLDSLAKTIKEEILEPDYELQSPPDFEADSTGSI